MKRVRKAPAPTGGDAGAPGAGKTDAKSDGKGE